MFPFPYLLPVYSIMALANSYTNGHVLFAANVDDFRTLAKRFVPEELADKLADMVNPTKKETGENDYYDEEESAADPKQIKNDEYAYHDDKRRVVERSNRKELHSVQVNIDELVQKVKERLLVDLRNMPKVQEELEAVKGEKINDKVNKLLNKHNNDEIKAPDKRISKTVGRVPINSSKSIQGMKVLARATEKWHENQATFVKQRQLAAVMPQPEGKIKEPEIEEDQDLYKKISLQSKGKKDSYEDYVAPKKEYDVFEEDDKKFDLRHGQQRMNVEITDKQQEVPSVLTSKITKAVSAVIQTTPEYYDDTETITEAEPKARTENLWYNSKEVNEHSRSKPIRPKELEQMDTVPMKPQQVASKPTTSLREIYSSPRVLVKKLFKAEGGPTDVPTKFELQTVQSTKKKRLATMMPTRQTYKMSSPDYLAKLPKVAEKYDFNEPLPEKDRQPEKIKQLGNPPKNINGKIKLR